MKRRTDTKKLATYALMISLAFILSYLETMIPVPYFVPGMKLGLANIVVITALYKMGTREALVLSLVRVLLSAMIFGNAFSLLYSAAGAILSFIVMYVMKKTDRFGVSGVSICGGVTHNFGQILVAIAVMQTSQIIFYFPVLVITGTVTGFIIGGVAGELIKRLKW